MVNRIDFERQEIKDFFNSLKLEYDVIRLVDPVTRKICYPQSCEGEICHEIWLRCERCENCTSLRAFRDKGRAYKLEILKDEVFWVTSRYIRIDGQQFVLELVKNVTKNFIINSKQSDKLAEVIETYNLELISDPLTGVYNRRFLDDNFIPSVIYSNYKIINLAVIDIDNFKHINDMYGHLMGDEILTKIGGCLKANFDQRDREYERIAVRYGGDEFLIITTNLAKLEFQKQMDKVQQTIESAEFRVEEHLSLGITYGLISSQDFKEELTFAQLFDIADQKMYEKKREKKQSRK